MKFNPKLAAVALVSAGALVGFASSASAAIVCNAANVCWHVKGRYHYKPEFGVVVHDNHWRWGANDHYTWREHRGRGYWRDNAWVRF